MHPLKTIVAVLLIAAVSIAGTTNATYYLYIGGVQ